MESIKYFIISLFLLSPISSEAKGFILFFGNSQKVSEVYKLPNEEYFQTDNGEHVNLGVVYKVFGIFGIPLFLTEDPSFVYTVDGKDDLYYNINDDAIKSIAKEYNIEDIESLKKVPFWDAWGGKILILAVILIFVMVSMASGNSADDAGDEKTEE